MTEQTIEQMQEQIDTILSQNSKADAFDKIVALSMMKLNTKKKKHLLPYIEGEDCGYAMRVNTFLNTFPRKHEKIAHELIKNLLTKPDPKPFPFNFSDIEISNRRYLTKNNGVNKSSPGEPKSCAPNFLRFIKIDNIKEQLFEMINASKFDEELFEIYKYLIKKENKSS